MVSYTGDRSPWLDCTDTIIHDHKFRAYGRAEAANALGKLSVELVSAFSGAVQDLPTEAYLFNDNVCPDNAKPARGNVFCDIE